MGDFVFVSRYGEGTACLPDVATMCPGQCEGMGWVPVHKDDPNDEKGPWHDLWLAAEAADEAGYGEYGPTNDPWHFVRCPTCAGTGKRPAPAGHVRT